MPELPEVETVVTTLRPHVVGKVVRRVQLLRPDMLHPPEVTLSSRLIGQEIVTLSRRGKRIVFKMGDGNQFYIHLGMSGSLKAHAPGDARVKHTHLIVDVGRIQIRFVDPRRFGGIFWIGTSTTSDDLLGPEPLTVRAAALSKKIVASRRAIKSVLLDQAVLAGMGNIYADEALFVATIHPTTLACNLSITDINLLTRAIKRVLRKAIRHRGSTLRDYRDANGETGGFQMLHNVYARQDKPCRTCKSTIVRIVVGGRSTHFCPKCQPGGSR